MNNDVMNDSSGKQLKKEKLARPAPVKTWIGVEFDDTEVHLVQLKKKNPVLVSERLPENLVVGGNVASPILMAKFLKDLMKQNRISGSPAVTILPESATLFREVTMPAIPESQVKLNLPYEFRDYIGTEGVNYIYDYAVEEITDDEKGDPAEMHLLAAAVPRHVVEDYTLLLRRVGKKLKLAVPREMALISLVRRAIEKDPSFAEREFCLIDIGNQSTRVFIFVGEKMNVNKAIDIGCSQIDETIASVTNVDTYLATTYRETNHDNVQNLSECTALYGRIALEVMKTINFYRYENNTTEVHEVFFTGVGAEIAPLVDAILADIDFDKRDIAELLPESCADHELAGRCAFAIGAVL